MGRLPYHPAQARKEITGSIVTARSTSTGELPEKFEAQGYTPVDVFHRDKEGGGIVAQGVRYRFPAHGGQYQAREREKRPPGDIARKDAGPVA